MIGHPMGRWLSAALLAALAAASAAAQITTKAIYGPDDRREPSEVQSDRIRGWADSTVALFQAEKVTVDAEKKQAALATNPFTTAVVKTPDNPWGESVELCQQEGYKGQAKGAFCSGSLVGEDLIMTAGHCVEDEESCKSGIKFVFGFRSDKEGQIPASVSSEEVYGCSKLVAKKLEGSGPDFAIVKLDRPVKDHPVLRIRRAGKPPVGSPLTVIGHPVGLPTKVAGGASIRKNDAGGYLIGNLDTYGGNSGSAVINTVTGEVEGILVRGETDFVYDEKSKCAKSMRKMDDTGRGEDVTLAEQVRAFIPDPHKPADLAFNKAGAALKGAKSLSFDGKF